MSHEKQKFSLSRKRLIWIGCALGLAYGLCARLVFGLEKTGEIFEIMSGSFIFGVPVALGFITVWLGEYRAEYSWGRRVLMPWLSSIVCLAACLVLAWEGLICVVLWLPLVLVLSSLGGLLAGIIRYFVTSNRSKLSCVGVVAIFPFLLAPVESMRQAAIEIRTTNTSIEINASPEEVWRQIRSVPKIEESEHFFSISHILGFPLPVEAVLEGTGVGAIRYARFEGDVLFIETVTEWEENSSLAFTIDANTENIPPKTFDEHVTIGGPYFDVLHGAYNIEVINAERVILHLSSDQRLSTRFNLYSHWWTEALMADLQNYILKIIKKRSEL